ncbi:MAG: hypothetical protein V3V08_25425 [Nannocystaceae bacterium]
MTAILKLQACVTDGQILELKAPDGQVITDVNPYDWEIPEGETTFRVKVRDDVPSGFKAYVTELPDAFDTDGDILAWRRTHRGNGSVSPKNNVPLKQAELRFVVIAIGESGKVICDDPILRVKPKT